MTPFTIQFDRIKAKANLRKHRVHLSDGEAVLCDPHALTLEDHHHDERRWVTLGNDGTGQILVVVYTYREPDVIRLISVRKAEPQEINDYRGE
jgi:uncharacterized DUF497 family protein